jgi:hypothetical protein
MAALTRSPMTAVSAAAVSEPWRATERTRTGATGSAGNNASSQCASASPSRGPSWWRRNAGVAGVQCTHRAAFDDLLVHGVVHNSFRCTPGFGQLSLASGGILATEHIHRLDACTPDA